MSPQAQTKQPPVTTTAPRPSPVDKAKRKYWCYPSLIDVEQNVGQYLSILGLIHDNKKTKKTSFFPLQIHLSENSHVSQQHSIQLPVIYLNRY